MGLESLFSSLPKSLRQKHKQFCVGTSQVAAKLWCFTWPSTHLMETCHRSLCLVQGHRNHACNWCTVTLLIWNNAEKPILMWTFIEVFVCLFALLPQISCLAFLHCFCSLMETRSHILYLQTLTEFYEVVLGLFFFPFWLPSPV